MKNNEGRKLFDGKSEELVIQKLEEVFLMGGTDQEACLYANISKSAFYEWQKRNEWFLERKETLKLNPILKARKTIVQSLDNPLHAKWYLEKKAKKEFGIGLEYVEGVNNDNDDLSKEATKKINEYLSVLVKKR